VLPVYVADQYEGFDAKPYPELSDAELEHYIAANAEAVRGVPTPDVALANHLVMGPVILARALDGRAPYAVKIHGSALEYTVRPNRKRFAPYALEGIRGAAGVLVGSQHTANSLFEVLAEEPSLPERTRLGPPGVDVHEFRPREPDLEQLAARPAAAWGGEHGSAEVLRLVDPSRDRIVSYVGKLIVSKGLDLLFAAWPLVVARVPDARLIVVGFGTYKTALEGFVDALRRADVPALREIAARGRELEGGRAGELRYLNAFLDTIDDDWLRAAPAAAERHEEPRAAPAATPPAGERTGVTERRPVAEDSAPTRRAPAREKVEEARPTERTAVSPTGVRRRQGGLVGRLLRRRPGEW
jgi:glycosyltransferase involved in cell wall biosynthesis